MWPVRLHGGGRESFEAFLSDDERLRAGRYRRERDRAAFVGTRAALRVLLGARAGIHPAAVSFAYGTNGKPHVAADLPIRFNVSHSGALAAIAIAEACDVGVDVEELRRMDDAPRIAARFFTAGECADLASLPAPERDAAFLRCWVRKEACLKASCDGLTADLDRFRVTLRPDESARVVSVGGVPGDASVWTLHELPVDAGYVGALAYAHATCEVRVRATTTVRDLLRRIA